ncbi:MAG: GntR family transcriptional regulator [Wenzhouxiangellaceae bacterium]
MDISIDLDDPQPVYAQLVAQIKQAVTDGVLRPKDPLPSIRQLAGDLAVNNKTVAKAYRLLERDAVIQTRGYRGTIIHPQAVANSTTDLSATAMAELRRVVDQLRAAQVTDSEIRIAFNNVMNQTDIHRSTSS